jgi:acyl-CoA synthetase (AMP-forming)/AMP-acid ligase II/thioesterase domain-containing protein
MLRTGPSTLLGVLQAHAQRTPDAVAVAAPDHTSWTYQTLLDETEQTVRALRGLGIGPSDRVALALPNGPELALAFLAVSSGAVSAPINPTAGGAELRSTLSALRARAVVVPCSGDTPAGAAARALGIEVFERSAMLGGRAGYLTAGSQLAPESFMPSLPDADDVAVLLSTSGTTARPRVVRLTHRNVLAGATNIAASLELTPCDRCLNLAQLFHGAGLMASVLASVVSGASVVCCPGFDVERFFDWLAEFRPTWYGAVPPIHAAVVAAATRNPERAAHTSLRFIRSGSAPLPLRVRAELERLFRIPVIEGYALSEAIQVASTSLRPQARKAGSVGIPAGIEVAIIDEAGTVVPAGEMGEIVCRGASVMRGYDDPAATEGTFVDGWLRTGDQGFLDADGYLFLTGRLKEIINRGGAKVSPSEVDGVLLEHPAVEQAATFPLPHDELGEAVAAAVVLRAGEDVSPGEIRAFAASRLAPFKVPGRIVMTPSIPVGPTGKVQRPTLAQQLGLLPPCRRIRAENVQRSVVGPRDLLEARLLQIWEDIFGGGPLDVTDDFFDLGGHSLLAALLMDEIERASGRRLHPSLLLETPTIEQLARAIQREASRRPVLAIKDGPGTAFIFLNGDLNGGGFYCVKLAAALDAGQAFYSISSHGIGGDPIPVSIEAMAASHLDAVRALQPTGPYLLGGFSHAGLIAFEMARQLEAQGEKVPLLFVVDMAADPRLRRRLPGPLARTAARWRSRLLRLKADMSGLDPGARVVVAFRRLRGYLSRGSSGRHLVELDGSEMTREGRLLFERYRGLVDRYVPRPYGGRVTLVVSSEDLAARSADPTLGWARIAADVKVLWMPGGHLTCVTRHVGVLAAHLRDSLREAMG